MCDRFCNRVKIKSPKYVLAHYHLTNKLVSFKNFIQVVVQGETEEFKQYAVNGTLSNLNRAVKIVDKFKNECEQSRAVVEGLRGKDRPIIAKVIQEYPANIRPFMYLNIGKDFSFADWTQDWEISKWMKFLGRYIDEDSANG